MLSDFRDDLLKAAQFIEDTLNGTLTEQQDQEGLLLVARLRQYCDRSKNDCESLQES